MRRVCTPFGTRTRCVLNTPDFHGRISRATGYIHITLKGLLVSNRSRHTLLMSDKGMYFRVLETTKNDAGYSPFE